MKGHLAIHPFLFATYPVLAALSNNIGQMEPAQVIRPLILTLLITGLLSLFFLFFYKNWDRAGFVTSLFLFMFFYYGYSYKFPDQVKILDLPVSKHIIILFFWIIFLVIVNSKFVWNRVRPQVITNYLNLTAAISMIFPLRIIIISIFLMSQDPLNGWILPPYPTPIHLQSSATPDIYYIVLDGYARSDVLQEIYSFDNTELIQFLEGHGFQVADKSQSNYSQTGLSLASSLNLEYLDNLSFAANLSQNRSPLKEMIANSRVRNLLADRGYKMIAFSTGYMLSTVHHADIYFDSTEGAPTIFEALLLSTSAFQALVDLDILKSPIPGYDTHRKNILYNFEQLEKIPEIEGPKFVFTHIIAPHPPFVFDENGHSINPNYPYTLGDGNSIPLTDEEYKKGYSAQLNFINQLVMETVSKLLDKSSIPPIIIIQADHGPGAYLNNESYQESCLKERFSILNAIYYPYGEMTDFYEAITPVNTFRVVFDAYFNTNLGLLEDRNYYSTSSHPYNFVDVTNMSQSSYK